MESIQKLRGWRKSIADAYEEQHGPHPDPVATFGAELVTAPSTPVLSSSMAGPDERFFEQLQERLGSLLKPATAPVNAAVREAHPQTEVHFSDFSSSETDEDESWRPWSFKAYCRFLRSGRKGFIRDYEDDTLQKVKQSRKRGTADSALMIESSNKKLKRRRDEDVEPAYTEATPKRTKVAAKSNKRKARPLTSRYTQGDG